MNLSEHVTLAEFTRSDTARRLGIDNSLPPELLEQARATCLMLERIRAHLSSLHGGTVPLIITSGYRNAAVSRAVGSTGHSDHVLACAADWVAPEYGTPFVVARELAAHVDELGIGQLINEFPGPDGQGWIHTSTIRPRASYNRVITIDRNASGLVETKVGVLESFS